MSHDLETRDGQVTFALRGAPAWHGLANTTFNVDDHVTTREMLDAALLSKWDVRLEEWETPEGYNSDKSYFRVIRNNPFNREEIDILGTVGERYHTYQNEDLFSFGDSILDGGAEWESAGSIKGGRKVFGSLRLPKEIVLDPSGRADKVQSYLLVVTSHDGSSSVLATTTPVRVVCQNTLSLALGGMKSSFKIRHSATVTDRAADARKALGLSFNYLDKFQEDMQALIEREITPVEIDKVIKALYPEPDKDAAKVAVTKHDNKIDTIYQIYTQSPTCENVKGTAWGLLNALTERLDYFRSGRKGTDEGILSAASGLDPATATERDRIYSVVKSLTLV
jgi:phage/plasmid-like protein (TIGR03299 family)